MLLMVLRQSHVMLSECTSSEHELLHKGARCIAVACRRACAEQLECGNQLALDLRDHFGLEQEVLGRFSLDNGLDLIQYGVGSCMALGSNPECGSEFEELRVLLNMLRLHRESVREITLLHAPRRVRLRLHRKSVREITLLQA